MGFTRIDWHSFRSDQKSTARERRLEAEARWLNALVHAEKLKQAYLDARAEEIAGMGTKCVNPYRYDLSKP